MARHFLLALVFLALAAPARAQNSERDRDTYNPSTTNVDITGQVRFGGGMSPAEGVRVTLEKVGGGTLDQMATDNRGRFHFTSLQRGQYVVNIKPPCYETVRRQVELVLIFRAYLDEELKPDPTPPPCAASPPAPVDPRRAAAPRR